MHVNNGKGEYFATEATSTHDGWCQAIAARPNFFEGGSCYFDISAAIDQRPGFHPYTPLAKGIYVLPSPRLLALRAFRERRN